MKRRLRLVGPVLLIFPCLPVDVPAQESPVLKARARVRVWAEGLADEGLDARLFKVQSDTVWVFADSASPRPIPVPSIRRFDVSRGRDPVLIIGGPLLGAAAGAVLLPILTTEDTFCELGVSEERECAKETSDVVAGAGAGFILTSVLLTFLANERWVGVPLETLALRLDVRRRRLGVALGARF